MAPRSVFPLSDARPSASINAAQRPMDGLGFFPSDFSFRVQKTQPSSPLFPSAFAAFVFLIVFSSGLSAVHYSLANESVCACQFATFKLHAENPVSEPVYSDVLISAPLPIRSLSELDVQLDGLQSKIIPFDVYAACDAKSADYDIQLMPAGSVPLLASLRVMPCDGLALEVTAQQTLCQNDHADFAVTVRNPSDFPRNVTLGTDLNPDAYSLPQTLQLLPHQNQVVLLRVNTNTLPQRLPFKVVARSDDGVFLEQPALIDVQACTGLRVSGPSDVSLLENASQSFSVEFQNIGAIRTVQLEAFCPAFVRTNASAITLGPSQKAAVAILVQSAPSGSYSCTLRGTSPEDGRVFSHTLVITVTPAVARYSLLPLEFTLEHGVLQNLTFQLHNDGLSESVPVYFESNATTVLSGPSKTVARKDQELVFFTNTDCHGYDIVLTHGGARRDCPEPTSGTLKIGGQNPSVRLHVRVPSLVFDSKAYADGSSLPSGVRVDFTVSNTGNATVLQLSGNPASRGPASVSVGAQSQAFFSVFVDGNASNMDSFVLQAKTDRGIYSTKTDLSRPESAAPATGLITLATPVMAFALAVLLALALLYLLYRHGKVAAA